MPDIAHQQQATKLRYLSVFPILSILFMFSGMEQAAAADVIDFALGEKNICIVDDEGVLECNSNNATRYIPPETVNTYSAVSSGGQHSCAITVAGEIECWGNANFGVLDVPVSNARFVAISSSEVHSCALDASGQVSCWGLNTNGQIDVPADNADFVAIYTGTVGSCGTKSSGLTHCWSNSFPYNLIDGQEGIIDINLPQKYNGEGACVVYEQGTVRCYSSFGSVAQLDNGPYTKVRSNGVMLCGLKTDGDMDCNLRNRDFTRTNINLTLLDDIQALPALIDFDTHYEYDYHMSFCGVDVNQQLHCLGESLPADNIPGELVDLPVPTNLSISVYGENAAELLWNVDLSQITGPQGQFRIYRNGEMVAQSYANASYYDRDFETGVPYIYEVAYIAPNGIEGALSEPLEVNGTFTDPNGDEVISAPDDDITLKGFIVSRYTENSLELFWDRLPGATRQYNVYRNGSLVASVPGPSYFDDQINATNAYQYTVVAISTTGSIQATGFAQVESFEGLQCF